MLPHALLRLVCSLLALGLSAGCAGYQLGSVKPAEFENISSIAVPTFKNDTLEPRASTLVTSEVVKQFHNDGTYIVKDVDSADAVLRGRIVRIDRAQLRSARFNTLRSRELRVRMEVEYILEEAGTGFPLSTGAVAGDTNIFIDRNFQLTERQAIHDMSRELAADLVSRLTEGWAGLESSPETDAGSTGAEPLPPGSGDEFPQPDAVR